MTDHIFFLFRLTRNLNQQVNTLWAYHSLPAAAILVFVGLFWAGACAWCSGCHDYVAVVNKTRVPVANLYHPGNGITVTQHPTGSRARRSPSAASSIINTPRQPSFFSFFFLARFRCLPACCHGNGVPATQQPSDDVGRVVPLQLPELESINLIQMPWQPS